MVVVVIGVYGGIRLGSKRNRRNEETIAIVESMLDIGPMGVDEFKWKIPAVVFQQRTAFVNQGALDASPLK